MMEGLVASFLALAEHGMVPDAIVRAGIRRLCRQRIEELAAAGPDGVDAVVASMRTGPIARTPERANAQHYEVPVEFFERVLGPHLKYSSAYYPPGVTTLAAAEAAALNLTMERAQLGPRQQILELGCGWGSLTLAMAERFPTSTILAVSGSASQRATVEDRCRAAGLRNVIVHTADMNDFDPARVGTAVPTRFDRIVSVEMFEHMRNYERLLARIAGWLRPDGRLFVHLFCHRGAPYTFEVDGATNWMGRHFFTGGLMPSFDIFETFSDHLRLDASWFWDGTHYQRTSNAWLRRLDADRRATMRLFRDVYGRDASIMVHRWRMFFMACAELFGLDDGQIWGVGHYLLEPASVRRAPVRRG